MQVVPTEASGDGSPAALDLKGHVLVLPGAGGAAHVGELCIDALIATWGLRRVAIVQSRHVAPVAMASAWERPADAAKRPLALTTAAELYQGPSAPGLTVLQLRSPALEGRRAALASELWSWARSQGVAHVVVVAPAAAFVKVDADLQAATELRYVHLRSRSGSDGGGELLVKAGLGSQVLPLAHSLPQPEEAQEGIVGRDLEAVQKLLRGSGLARSLLLLAGGDDEATSTGAAPELPEVTGLLAFSSAGRNWRVVEQLLRATCQVLAARIQTPAPEVKFPPSWHIEAASAQPVQYLFG